MNYCQTCLSAKDISTCSESLTIGTATADTAYKVYIKNLSTQRIDVFETTSTNAGLIIISLGSYVFNEGNPYEIWVTEDGASPNSHEQLTVGTFITTCITLSAIAYKNASDGCNVVVEDEVIIPEEDNEDFVASTCVCVTQEMLDALGGSADIYRALLTQTGTDAPEIVSTDADGNQNPFENTIGNIVWSYDIPGNFKGTLAGAFPDGNKLYFSFVNTRGRVSASAVFFADRLDNDTIYLTTANYVIGGINPGDTIIAQATDGLMEQAEILILRFP